MNLTHRFSVPAKLDAAWAAFSQLDQIAPCFPGATVTEVDGRDYSGFVKIKFGPIPLMYNGTAQITELNQAARRMVVRARGKDRRGNGTASANVTATFTETGNITDIQVLTDLSITGRPAQFGGGVISDVSDRLLDLFVNCVSARFTDGEFAPDPGAADIENTIKIPVVGVEEPEVEATAGSAQARTAGPKPGPRSAPYVYAPPKSAAEPHLQALGTLVPVILKRYWPVLIGIGIGVAVANRIFRRRRAR
jgi:uncharacterized protein